MEHQNLYISSSKNKIFRLLSGYILVLVLVLYCSNWIFELVFINSNKASSAYKISRLINEYHENEIPVFGSSRAENSYVPSLLGQNVFNYGLSGTKDDVLLFCLEMECSKLKSTPIIINFDYEGLDKEIAYHRHYIPSSNNDKVEKLLGEEFKWHYRVPFIKYFGKFEFYIKDYINSRVNLTLIYEKGGAFPIKKLTFEKFRRSIELRLSNTTLFYNDPFLETELLRIIKANPDRLFVFVISPVHESYIRSLKNRNKADEYLNSMNDISNVILLNLSNAVVYDSLFFDTIHLNFEGAKEFSKILKDSLESEYGKYYINLD